MRLIRQGCLWLLHGRLLVWVFQICRYIYRLVVTWSVRIRDGLGGELKGNQIHRVSEVWHGSCRVYSSSLRHHKGQLLAERRYLGLVCSIVGAVGLFSCLRIHPRNLENQICATKGEVVISPIQRLGHIGNVWKNIF